MACKSKDIKIPEKKEGQMCYAPMPTDLHKTGKNIVSQVSMLIKIKSGTISDDLLDKTLSAAARDLYWSRNNVCSIEDSFEIPEEYKTAINEIHKMINANKVGD